MISFLLHFSFTLLDERNPRESRKELPGEYIISRNVPEGFYWLIFGRGQTNKYSLITPQKRLVKQLIKVVSGAYCMSYIESLP